MPIILPKVSDYVDVPLRCDDALDMTDEQYNHFLDTLDPNVLVYKQGVLPTFFRMRKMISYGHSQKIEDMKIGMERRKDGDAVTNEVIPRIAWAFEEVRLSLTDVINPPNVPEDQQIVFKRDADGGASTELMAALKALGVDNDLCRVRQTMGGGKKVDKKK